MSDPHAASRNRSPWIAWYGQDFRDGVVEMSDAAAGVYAKLLSYQIVKGSIPDPKRDVNGCAKAAVTTPQKLLRVWREIEGKFVPCDGERLENPRCSQEIAIRDGIRASRSAGAKITNERRAQRSAQRPVERSASRARSPSPSPVSADADKKNPPDPPGGSAGKPRRGAFSIFDLDLPFTSEPFRSALADWEQHRRESGKPLKPTGAREQLARMAEWGEARAIAAIRHSAANGWQGLFEPTVPGKPAQAPAPKYTSDTGPKERALKEREKQLREELPNEAATAAMLAKLAEKFPTQRT